MFPTILIRFIYTLGPSLISKVTLTVLLVLSISIIGSISINVKPYDDDESFMKLIDSLIILLLKMLPVFSANLD